MAFNGRERRALDVGLVGFALGVFVAAALGLLTCAIWYLKAIDVVAGV